MTAESMTEMKPIERIARAIQEAANNGADSPVDYGDAEALAKVALLAMPTPILRAAAEIAIGEDLDDIVALYYVLRQGAEPDADLRSRVKRAMIDKAPEPS